MFKRLCKISVFLCFLILISIPAYAADEESPLYRTRDSIFSVQQVYIDENEVSHVLEQGTCFAIGDGTGINYLVTEYGIVTQTLEEKQETLSLYGTADDDQVETSLQIVVKKDVILSATMVTGSESMDFAILKLDQSLFDKNAVKMSLESDKVLETAKVYSFGVACANESNEITGDIEIADGIVKQKVTHNDIPYLMHSANYSAGSIGGPVLNENGEVIGMNVVSWDENIYALQISEVLSVMDTLGIVYIQPEPEEVIAIDYSALQSAIDEGSSLVSDSYTKESWASYQEAFDNANVIAKDAKSTQESIDEALLTLQSAKDGLVQKEGLSTFTIILIAAIVVLVLLIVILILIIILNKNKAKSNSEEKKSAHRNKQSGMTNSTWGNDAGMPTNRSLVQPEIKVAKVENETTVLSSQESFGNSNELAETKVTPILERVKTGEKIAVNKRIFSIGKDGSQVDYCISGNGAISRVHATISLRGTDYFIKDMNTTNGTYADGNRLNSGEVKKLSNDSIIQIANEKFVFKL